MNSDEVLTTDFRIAELVDVRNSRSGHFSSGTFAGGLITKPTFTVVREHCFPHQALLYSYYTVRTVVIMDRSFLPRSPTNDEHLSSFVTTNAMTPVITFLETKVRFEIILGDVDVGKPGIDLFQFRR